LLIYYIFYHHAIVNKIIHFIFVPMILCSFVMMLNTIPVKIPVLTDLYAQVGVTTTVALVAAHVLCLYYLFLDFIVGFILSFEIAGFIYAGSYMYHTMPAQQFWAIVLVMNVVSWAVQFIGHGVFEKRRPALADNVFQVFIAPAFVTLEALFWFGYQQEMQDRVEIAVKDRLEKYRNKAK